eukprot:gene26497-63786_t
MSALCRSALRCASAPLLAAAQVSLRDEDDAGERQRKLLIVPVGAVFTPFFLFLFARTGYDAGHAGGAGLLLAGVLRQAPTLCCNKVGAPCGVSAHLVLQGAATVGPMLTRRFPLVALELWLPMAMVAALLIDLASAAMP